MEPRADRLQDGDAGLDDLGADAVTRQQRNSLLHDRVF
jgi:hypothetical protein